MTDAQFINTVKRDLRQGYGVEDIKVRHGIEPTETRKLIEAMDDCEVLDRIYGEMRFDMRSSAEASGFKVAQ